MIYFIILLLLAVLGTILYIGQQLKITNKKLNDIVHNTAVIGRRIK